MTKITIAIAFSIGICSPCISADTHSHIKQTTANMPTWVVGSLGSNINQTWIFYPGPKISAIKYGIITAADLELAQKQDYSFASEHNITFSQFADTVPELASLTTDLLNQGYKQVILNVYPHKEMFKDTINDPDHCPPCTQQKVLLESIASKEVAVIHIELKM
ncbi:hypothetical protein E0Z06_00050 [Rheinheimera sp. D18]|uniref:hypothetical protein n=1 Tax=Rheinheimera sp. D18 TaxID=2545632 RepID=UPI001043C640|nr:hypothetical protein [Rheinheimera sp. D18]QBL08019.1 hypothetical protein E0Z06_00050 [Rheinheimera sp. D18]